MKILNIGSLNLDYVYRVDHFVRAGETLASSDLQIFPGGKGLNQSLALARAGARVMHAGKIGADGEILRKTLADAGVDASLVETCEGASGHAVIQVDRSGQNSILLYAGANGRMGGEFIEKAVASCGAGDILLLQNEINGLPLIIKRARKKGLRIALNPSPYSEDIARLPLEEVEWFLLNEIEGADLTQKSEPREIAGAILQRYSNAKVVLTLGDQGVLYMDKEQCLRHGIYQVPVVDTTAAGDAFTGYFLAGVAGNLPIERNLQRASLAAALTVSRKGAAPSIPFLAEVSGS